MEKIRKIIKNIIIIFIILLILAVCGLITKYYFFTPSEDVKSMTFLGSENKKIVSVDVHYKLNGFGGKVKIDDLQKSDDGIVTTVGNMGHPVDITVKNRSVENAKISFKYDPDLISEEQAVNLKVAYFNEELGRMELLGDSEVDVVNNTVSVSTTHFSKYVVVDSEEWYNAWAESQLVIRNMNSGNKYFDVIFTIDASGSMSGDDKNGLSKSCTYNFIKNLYSGDYFTILKFSDSSECVQSKQLMEDVVSWENIEEKINTINAGGGTNIEQAVLNSLEMAEIKVDDSQSLIVLLSDGQASISDETLNKAVNANVKIITIGLGSDADETLLKRIADSTGGQYYKATTENLNIIFEKIREAYIGIDLSEDTDKDGIPDKIETMGMRNQYGNVIRTDANDPDTDNDGISDGIEMGSVVINEDLSEEDKNRSLNQYVYFDMRSDPTVYDQNKEYDPKLRLDAKAELLEDNTTIKFEANIENEAKVPIDGTDTNNQINAVKDVTVNISMPACMGKSWDEGFGNINSGGSASVSRELKHDNEKCVGDKHIITIEITTSNTVEVIEEIRVKGIYWYENLSENEYNDEQLKLIEKARAYCSEFDMKKVEGVLEDRTLSLQEKKDYINDLKNSMPQRWAMNYLTTNDIFVAHSFKNHFEQLGFLQKGAFVTTKVVLSDGAFTSLFTEPDKTRYKKMLFSYINENYTKDQERFEIDTLMSDCAGMISNCEGVISELEESQATLTKECNNALNGLKKSVEYLKKNDKTTDGIFREIENVVRNAETLEKGGVVIKDPFSIETNTLKSLNARYAKIDDVSKTVKKIALTAETVTNLIDAVSYCVEVNACMSTYEEYGEMLELIAKQSQYKDLADAARELKTELDDSKAAYWASTLDFFEATAGMMTEGTFDLVVESLATAGGTAAKFADVTSSVGLGVVIVKIASELGVGLSDMLDGAQYAIGSAEVSRIFSDKLSQCRLDFNVAYSKSKEEAYQAALEYQQYYEHLREMRIIGEQSYIDMRDFSGADKTLNSWLNGWSNFAEAENFCNQSINHLREIEF